MNSSSVGGEKLTLYLRMIVKNTGMKYSKRQIKIKGLSIRSGNITFADVLHYTAEGNAC